MQLHTCGTKLGDTAKVKILDLCNIKYTWSTTQSTNEIIINFCKITLQIMKMYKSLIKQHLVCNITKQNLVFSKDILEGNASIA